MTSSYLDTIRCPVTRARNNVMAADANLTGLVKRLASDSVETRDTIRQAIAKCRHARQDMDRAIYVMLGVEALNGRRLEAEDADDMADALLARLERNELIPRATAYEPRLTKDDCLPKVCPSW